MEDGNGNGGSVRRKRNMGRRREKPEETGGDVEMQPGGDGNDDQNFRRTRDHAGIDDNKRVEKDTTRPSSNKSHTRFISVLGEDIEEGDVPLAEVSSVMKVPLGDPWEGSYDSSKVNWEYTPDRRGKWRGEGGGVLFPAGKTSDHITGVYVLVGGHLLYVENPKTGFLVPVSADGQGPPSEPSPSALEDGTGDDEEVGYTVQSLCPYIVCILSVYCLYITFDHLLHLTLYTSSLYPHSPPPTPMQASPLLGGPHTSAPSVEEDGIISLHFVYLFFQVQCFDRKTCEKEKKEFSFQCLILWYCAGVVWCLGSDGGLFIVDALRCVSGIRHVVIHDRHSDDCPRPAPRPSPPRLS